MHRPLRPLRPPAIFPRSSPTARGTLQGGGALNVPRGPCLLWGAPTCPGVELGGRWGCGGAGVCPQEVPTFLGGGKLGWGVAPSDHGGPQVPSPGVRGEMCGAWRGKLEAPGRRMMRMETMVADPRCRCSGWRCCAMAGGTRWRSATVSSRRCTSG